MILLVKSGKTQLPKQVLRLNIIQPLQQEQQLI